MANNVYRSVEIRGGIYCVVYLIFKDLKTMLVNSFTLPVKACLHCFLFVVSSIVNVTKRLKTLH